MGSVTFHLPAKIFLLCTLNLARRARQNTVCFGVSGVLRVAGSVLMGAGLAEVEHTCDLHARRYLPGSSLAWGHCCWYFSLPRCLRGGSKWPPMTGSSGPAS